MVGSYCWLVVTGTMEFSMTFHILGMSSSQLTFLTHIFQKGLVETTSQIGFTKFIGGFIVQTCPKLHCFHFLSGISITIYQKVRPCSCVCWMMRIHLAKFHHDRSLFSRTLESWVISHVPIFHITQPLGIWSIMATIRWCPIFPKWDSYQPLWNHSLWGESSPFMAQLFRFVNYNLPRPMNTGSLYSPWIPNCCPCGMCLGILWADPFILGIHSPTCHELFKAKWVFVFLFTTIQRDMME